MRRRVIKPNTRSYTGHMGILGSGIVRFESGLERDFLITLRSRSDLVNVVSQPQTVSYVDPSGTSRRYTPDFRATFADQRVVFYECKYRDQLRKDWDHFRFLIPCMRQLFREREGAAYRVVTEQIIRGVRFENVRLLAPFRELHQDPEVTARLYAIVRDRGALSVADLLFHSGFERGRFFAGLWPLVANRQFIIDWDQPIGMQTILEVQDE